MIASPVALPSYGEGIGRSKQPHTNMTPTPTPTPTEAAALDALRAIRTQAELTARAFPNAPGREDLLTIARIAQNILTKHQP